MEQITFCEQINGTQQKNQILESKEFFKKQNVDTIFQYVFLGLL